ncbi:MAG: tetratricopeptide repeat protein, partial [Kofleriaceae bacterium]|nr:tetratricopeptide repeat protein [Kofleriaceae bacterium]
MAINKNKVMDAGRKAYEKGQYDKALREYLKIVKEDPKDVRVWLKIGDLYTKKQSNTEATETYMKVAAYYSEQGFFKKSVAVYKQILRVDPRLVEVNLKLAELYRQLGLLQDAMQHFEMVAAFFHREGKTQEALATLRQLVDLDPENVATRIKLAEVYSKEQMVPEAVREFTTTCDFLRKNGRQEDFLKVAERLLFHEPDNLDLCRELATLYLKRNDPRRALAKLQICFKADQSDPSVLALLAQAFQRLDQKGKTVSVLKELARVHTESGRKKEATEVHEKILQYVPADPDSLTFLGRGAKPSALAENVEFDAQDIAPPVAPKRSPVGRSTGSMPIVSAADNSYEEPVYEVPEEAEFLDSSLLDSDTGDEFPREDSFVADLELIEEEAAY